MAFAITDDKGYYTLKLSANKTYEIGISYLGYGKLTQTVNLNENATQNFVLEEETDSLEEILIKHKIPIIVRKDTIIYNVESFATGSERKLRDVLKNLPGVEVDRDGNVSVNGKRVTKVLVEGKTFFTGDSKLAVNNIPADAAETIEIIDDYHDVPMLKGLQDSDDMAMNIRLKEDKKKFVFGDIEAAGGIKDRYVLNPKIFYYSPKTNVSFIGDMNNIAEKSFTLRDYLEFEGGMSRLMRDAGTFSTLFGSEIAQFIAHRDFTSNVSQFAAVNIRQAVSANTDVSGYVISSNSKTETETATLNRYTSGTPFTETQTGENRLNNFFTLGKVMLQHSPSFEEDLSFSGFFKIADNHSSGLVTTLNPIQNNRIETKSSVDAFQLKQDLKYSRKLSKTHTITLEAVYNYQQDNLANRWITDRQILQGLIPLEDEAVYRILQTKRSAAHSFNGILKDYWVLHRFHHLYTSLGVNVSFTDFFNEDFQQLSDGSSNYFSASGFGNDFDYDMVNTYLGLEYKFQKGIAVFKPAVYFHFFHWQTNQFGSKTVGDKAVILPKLDADFTFSSSEKLTFRYGLNTRFPTTNQLADRFVLSSFNSVFRGNSTLEDERYHTASLNYRKFRLFKGFQFYITTSFNKKEKHFKNVTELNGIEQYNTVILFDNPEHNWNTSGMLSKVIKDIRFGIQANYNYTDFYQLLNQQESLNISKRISGTLSARTLFKKFPAIELGYTKEHNNYRSAESVNNFENNRFFGSMDYAFLKDFIFKADYSYDAYSNKAMGITSYFDNANASLFYQKEDSPWGFEVSATNIFNVTFKQQNSFSDFLISDSKTFIFPRVILLKIAYKL